MEQRTDERKNLTKMLREERKQRRRDRRDERRSDQYLPFLTVIIFLLASIATNLFIISGKLG